MKPAFDPSMSDGCSVPEFLQHYIPQLQRLCELVKLFCIQHDEKFYNGGTIEEFHAANEVLYQQVLPYFQEECGIEDGERWATMWHGAINTVGWSHWGTGRAWNGRTMWEEAGTQAP